MVEVESGSFFLRVQGFSIGANPHGVDGPVGRFGIFFAIASPYMLLATPELDALSGSKSNT